MHGVTKSVTFTVSAERVGSEIDLLADITIPFSRLGHLEPQHRRLRHHGKHRDPRGPPPPDRKGRGNPASTSSGLEQLERWRWSDHGAEHDGPAPHRPLRLTSASVAAPSPEPEAPDVTAPSRRR